MLKYDQIVSTSTVASRVAQENRERHEAMLRRAHEAGLTIERDTINRGAWVIANPATPGRIELATTAGCSCSFFRIWGRCPHNALVIEQERHPVLADAA